ncbi:MAG TPA: DUF3369 domain-containing protein [Xanthomonadaceae bacterium]|nr:DUF3369 domain-containing protein [Xanthomonadaceae bacterium]
MQTSATTAHSRKPWKLLIVDDEEEVHVVTRLVLSDFLFEGRDLEFLHAYSAKEAKAVLARHPDVALMLVDVVMETDHAGLDLVRYIRAEVGNRFVRIVLRTGQPGQAPEHQVIRDFDINDYKEKTELTSRKLSTLLYAALRAYRDIMIIEEYKCGLERVIDASAHIFSHQRSREFASAVLAQLTNVVGIDCGALHCKVTTSADGRPGHFHVTSATGAYSALIETEAEEQLPAHIAQSLQAAYNSKQHQFGSDHYVLHFVDSQHGESLLYVGNAWELSDLDLRLLKVFCTNISIAFDNLHLNQELFESQLEMICLLAGAAETRSRETANHVKRVGLLAEFLAAEMGLDEKASESLRYAAPLHDIGKIAIPDMILNKPGPHTAEETVVMRTHAEMGAQMLGQSRRPLLKLASEIAATHHENWDGSGYPAGLLGNAIPIAGRITALADVCDALGSKRCYKDPWPSDEVLTYLKAQRGRKFDPQLVDILIGSWERASAVRRMLPD